MFFASLDLSIRLYLDDDLTFSERAQRSLFYPMLPEIAFADAKTSVVSEISVKYF